MSREEFEAIVAQVADYLPPEEVAVATWNRLKIMDPDAVVSGLHRTKSYKTHFRIIKPIIARSISDIPDMQLGKDIIALIDTYYPAVMKDIAESDENGNNVPGNMLADVIRRIILEVRS